MYLMRLLPTLSQQGECASGAAPLAAAAKQYEAPQGGFEERVKLGSVTSLQKHWDHARTDSNKTSVIIGRQWGHLRPSALQQRTCPLRTHIRRPPHPWRPNAARNDIRPIPPPTPPTRPKLKKHRNAGCRSLERSPVYRGLGSRRGRGTHSNTTGTKMRRQEVFYYSARAGHHPETTAWIISRWRSRWHTSTYATPSSAARHEPSCWEHLSH
jgi:hypothetical protein